MPAQGCAEPGSPNPPDADGTSESPSNGEDKEEYISVYLPDIRKEMQCPICLGIIRKTRTVMECLHRFCRACIDKSMRLGNNECPACRAHCASRRSLRDDPNFDNLVAALYPNLDQYEEEEMADFGDQIHVNRQIQENIAGTFKRQSAAIARRRTTAAEILRKAHGNFQIVHSRQRRGRARGRGRGGGRGFRSRSRYEEEDDSFGSGNGQSATSGDETQSEPEPKRRCFKRQVSGYTTGEESSDAEPLSAATAHETDGRSGSLLEHEIPTESTGRGADDEDASPTTNREALKTWARAGARSHTRHGSITGAVVSNGKNRSLRPSLLGKDIIDALLAAARTEIEEEFVVHLSLQPLNDGSDDEDTLPSLRKPNLSCPPNMTIQHLCKFLMMQLIPRPELELEILVESKSEQLTVPKPPQRLSKLSKGKAWVSRAESGKEVVLLSSGHTLATVLSDFWDYRGNLELLYRRKS
ncbi:hypothetical protein CY35_02G109800 [Sphagnum magellanicum]|nr:hypothetical protein CY35_02G109800 [Sphagnum magellanicum]KAH9571750.1 hypothetical protein CY35_02G109800 [Sphagnum magellanicum]